MPARLKFRQCVFRWQSLEPVGGKRKRTKVAMYRCQHLTDHSSGLCPQHQALRSIVKDFVEGVAALVDLGGSL